MKYIIKNTIFALWFFLCCVVLFSIIRNKSFGSNNEIIELFVLEMLILSAPLGYIFAILISLLSLEVPILFSVLINWGGMVLAGYIQWFILFPKILRWVKKMLTKSIGSNQ